MGQSSLQLPAARALSEMPVLFVVVMGALLLFNLFSALPLGPADLHMHMDHWICLVSEGGSRSLYAPVRRAVQKLFGLIFILALGNFLLCALGSGQGEHVAVLPSDNKGISTQIRNIRDADGNGRTKVTRKRESPSIPFHGKE